VNSIRSVEPASVPRLGLRLLICGGSLRSSRTRRAVLHNAAAFGLLGVTGLLAPAARASSLRVGQPAPPATLVTLDGKRLATSDLLGRVVILTFLATWCEPCRDELPLLSAYQQAHAAQGLTVLGFSLDESDHLDEVRAMAAPLRFPVGLLSASQAPGYGRIWHIPVSFTIDRAGRLADDGWKDKHPVWTSERLERVVAPLLT
jgi:cytochrome c biogenesis protein CcmG/thiol:disulfide interchange protein DsbE